MIDIRILLAIRLAFRDRSSRSRHESSNNVDEKYLINCLLRLDCNDAYDELPKVVSEQGHGNGTTVESPPLNMSTALFSIEVESHSSADIIIFASLADSQGLNGRRIGSSVSSSMNHISNLTATTSSEDYCQPGAAVSLQKRQRVVRSPICRSGDGVNTEKKKHRIVRDIQEVSGVVLDSTSRREAKRGQSTTGREKGGRSEKKFRRHLLLSLSLSIFCHYWDKHCHYWDKQSVRAFGHC
jgi:hypothetical protein